MLSLLEKPEGLSQQQLRPFEGSRQPPGGSTSSYTCSFGLDALPRSALGLLRQLKGRLPAGQELGLREAQAVLAAERQLFALRMEGFQHHDLGNPEAYWRSLQHFARGG